MKWIRFLRKIFYLQLQKGRLITLGLTTVGSSRTVAVKSVFDSRGHLRPDRQPYHLNAAGLFYSVKDCCIICLAPQSEAPELIGLYEDPSGTNRLSHCFFKKQPETPNEVDNAIRAMWVSCVENLRYAGDDPAILERLCEMGLRDLCDAFDKDY